jgi:hypothetical protein
MSTTTATVAAPAARPGGVVGAVRDAFPLRSVVLPWLVARLLLVPALVLPGPGKGPTPGQLLAMDGQWFRFIALDWYDRPYVSGGWSEYPFFPLYPAMSGVLMDLGMPDTVALAGMSWLAALLASAGAYRLASRHLDPSVASWVPWFVALAPGGVAMVLGYADSLWLAATLWALVLAEDRRWWAAGIVAAVATASRPNGVVTVLALVVAVLVARAGWRAVVACGVPSAIFLAWWMWWLHGATGDAFVFWSAKDAWDELSLGGLLTDPLDHEVGLFHLTVALVVLVPYAMRVRRQPAAWAVVVAGTVAPPLVLGVEGLARYVTMAFPIPFAVADVLVGRSRALAAAFLAASSAATVALALLVVSRSWVP